MRWSVIIQERQLSLAGAHQEHFPGTVNSRGVSGQAAWGHPLVAGPEEPPLLHVVLLHLELLVDRLKGGQVAAAELAGLLRLRESHRRGVEVEGDVADRGLV